MATAYNMWQFFHLTTANQRQPISLLAADFTFSGKTPVIGRTSMSALSDRCFRSSSWTVITISQLARILSVFFVLEVISFSRQQDLRLPPSLLFVCVSLFKIL